MNDEREAPGSIPKRLSPANEQDPYLLIVLADREIENERVEQAKALIEAAYMVYDQCSVGS
jgi:hypothetical protein